VSGFHVAVVPVGKIDTEELEAVMTRAAKALRVPLELRDGLGVPRGIEDIERGQFRAAALMGRLAIEVAKLSPGKLVGGEDPEAKVPLRPNGYVFLTDVDLFTANSDGVFAALISGKKVAIVSIRRLREAHYRRKADPIRQRTRVVKELARMAARLQGAAECKSADCVLAPSKSIPDLDAKTEMFCRNCSQLLFEGKIQV
jgi:predicted Zn-dependent protease